MRGEWIAWLVWGGVTVAMLCALLGALLDDAEALGRARKELDEQKKRAACGGAGESMAPGDPDAGVQGDVEGGQGGRGGAG